MREFLLLVSNIHFIHTARSYRIDLRHCAPPPYIVCFTFTMYYILYIWLIFCLFYKRGGGWVVRFLLLYLVLSHVHHMCFLCMHVWSDSVIFLCDIYLVYLK